MLSLEQIKDSINHLRELEDMDEIQSGIQEIFYSLICSDQPFYLAYSENKPFMSPASSDQTHLYLRLFSHKELADKYVNRMGLTEAREHSVLDILQIGHWAMLSGGYGYILNEGDLWIGSAITDFLSLFLSRIYGEDSLISPEYISTINFINEVRRNSFFRYGAVYDEEENWTGTVRAEQEPPIIIQSLFHVPKDILVIEQEGNTLSIPKESLLKGLSLCRITEIPDSPLFGTEYIDEPDSSIFQDNLWQITDPSELALTFDPIPDQLPDQLPEPTSNDLIIEEDKPETEETEEENSDSTREINSPIADTENTQPKPKRKKKNPKVFLSLESEKKDPEEVILQTPAEPPEEEPVLEQEPSPFIDNLEEDDVKRPSRKEKKKSSKKAMIIGVAAILLITGISIFVIKEVRYREALKDFRTCISYQDYANAYTLYIDTEFGKDGDIILTDEVDSLILRYANNEISAEELSASLEALANFQSITQNLEIARLTASKLEESKNAYVIGRESTDIFERLNTWRQVVQLDSSNYAAVQQNVNDNQRQYIEILRSDIEYYRTRSLDFAKERFDVLSYWYPDSEYIPILSREFTADQSSALSFYPVKIYETKIKQETNGYWTLHIGWKNVSVKTIDSIRFSVVALGEDGSVITCEDEEGKWNIFDANDRNRYEPGEEPASGYYWYRVFYGPDVREVKLTAVNVTYRDGTTATYTSDTDLRSLQAS